MKRLSVAVGMVMVLSSALVQAQEIGTEITPVTPDNKPQPQPNDNPYANTQQPPKEGDKPVEKPKAAAVQSGGSAEKGAFGIRGTFGGQGIPAVSLMSSAASPTGTVGLAYWATEQFTLLFDLGFGMGIGGSFALGFGATVGMDYHFRTSADALRPLINVQVGIGSPIRTSIGSGMSLFGQIAGGAEYFFSPSFSLTGRIGLGFSLPFDNAIFSLATFTPALGAAWYF